MNQATAYWENFCEKLLFDYFQKSTRGKMSNFENNSFA